MVGERNLLGAHPSRDAPGEHVFDKIQVVVLGRLLVEEERVRGPVYPRFYPGLWPLPLAITRAMIASQGRAQALGQEWMAIALRENTCHGWIPVLVRHRQTGGQGGRFIRPEIREVHPSVDVEGGQLGSAIRSSGVATPISTKLRSCLKRHKLIENHPVVILYGGDRTSQAKVLSTTHRRGNRWKPGKPVCFLTTSIRHPNWMPELIGKLRAGTTTVGPDFCDGMKE